MNTSISEHLCLALEPLLPLDAPGQSEYQLIQTLRSKGLNLPMGDTASLFHSHFLIFHGLYLLQQRWRSRRYAHLEIHTLHIQAHSWSQRPPGAGVQTDEETTALPQAADPLAAFYLDWNNLGTELSTLEIWLDRFWRRLGLPDETLQQALADLELPAQTLQQADWPNLARQQYQRLAMQHHPDRGGDSERFKQVQHAWQLLKNYL
ncbi:DNA-J related domain-containing protein [Balneatrix alpica]|uniref:DNA-J related domain-containing protein n=1 Tax=Balneatrix alpica TaxID=75684 RepID=UPI002739B214|nr:DNA-J related domain-containing protein [Balneatrix alpica]